MSLTAAQAEHLRDHVEATLADVTARVLRAFLAGVTRAALTAPPSLLASVEPEPLPSGEVPTLGTQAAYWAAQVDAHLTPAIGEAYALAYEAYAPSLTVTSPAEEAMRAHIVTVRDRLVRGTYFGVPVFEESFEAVRESLALAQVHEWTREELARHIAASLSWDGDSDYWQGVKDRAGAGIDAILDPLGEPGSPARELARATDPRVRALQELNATATKHLDAEQSIWETRASLIARTESTGLANNGALHALAAEGVTHKRWLAARDSRTRESHRRADGQVVALTGEFTVGGWGLQYPGDPSAPVSEVANCRCAMIGADA